MSDTPATLEQAKADAASLRAMYERWLGRLPSVGNSYRCRKGLKQRVAALEPIMHQHRTDLIGAACCGAIRITNPVNFHRAKPALSFALLDCCRPSAIVRRVVRVRVKPVDRMFGAGTRPHIGAEILERRGPPVAYLNSTLSIEAKGFGCAVAAPLPHSNPYLIFRSPAHPVRFAFLSRFGMQRMIGTNSCAVVSGKASAGTRRATGQTSNVNRLLYATVANAIEKIVAIARPHFTSPKNKKAPKSLADQIAWPTHV